MALFDELPLTSTLSPKLMRRAQALLTELASVRADIGPLEEKKAELSAELESIQLNFDLPGLRHGNMAFASVESKGRSTLNKEKLILAGVTAKTIELCTDVGKPYRVKNMKVRTEKGWE